MSVIVSTLTGGLWFGAGKAPFTGTSLVGRIAVQMIASPLTSSTRASLRPKRGKGGERLRYWPRIRSAARAVEQRRGPGTYLKATARQPVGMLHLAISDHTTSLGASDRYT
jgi:hypothetical protein